MDVSYGLFSEGDFSLGVSDSFERDWAAVVESSYGGSHFLVASLLSFPCRVLLLHGWVGLSMRVDGVCCSSVD